MIGRRAVGAAAALAAAVLAVPAPTSAAVTAPTTAVAASSFPDHLRGVHHARQLVVVTARGYGDTQATVRVYRRSHGGWRHAMGPWQAWIGTTGFARPGRKREGDGHTPTGSFLFPFAFGAGGNPGVHYRWRRTRSTSFWDDDSGSRNYNRWVDTRRGNAGRNPEPMRVRPYRLGIVIGYNTARTPGRGSAIFLHVTHDSPTAGCVALPYSRLHRLLRWLRPATHARIIMGTDAAVRR